MDFKKNNLRQQSVENPYVKGAEGRKEWNDRYMNMSMMIKRWQIAFFSAITVVVILAGVVGKIATESKVVPFIVETHQGMPYAMKAVQPASAQDPMLISYAINQFIINARTVIGDAEGEKALLNKLYAYSANNTIGFLHEYFEKNNPFEKAAQFTVSVNIESALPVSKNTWQVTWHETKRSTNGGAATESSRWVANLTYKMGDVNSRFINDNPFGLYVTDVSWSQIQS